MFQFVESVLFLFCRFELIRAELQYHFKSTNNTIGDKEGGYVLTTKQLCNKITKKNQGTVDTLQVQFTSPQEI